MFKGSLQGSLIKGVCRASIGGIREYSLKKSVGVGGFVRFDQEDETAWEGHQTGGLGV